MKAQELRKLIREEVRKTLNESISIPLTDEYAKQIWSNRQVEIMKLVDSINSENYDHVSSEIVCDALSEIFAVLSDKPGKAYNFMNKKQ